MGVLDNTDLAVAIIFDGLITDAILEQWFKFGLETSLW